MLKRIVAVVVGGLVALILFGLLSGFWSSMASELRGGICLGFIIIGGIVGNLIYDRRWNEPKD
jgi:hypothetical protein